MTSPIEPLAPITEPEDTGQPWLRLSPRMIWADLFRTIVSLSPALIAVWIAGTAASFANMWPFIIIAVFGVGGAIADVLRWMFTRYRITEHEVQRTAGIFVRRSRTISRDRIRSVDLHAKLRHRFFGLRVVAVGAGQQVTAGESALALDALSKADAEQLRTRLIGDIQSNRKHVATASATSESVVAESVSPATATDLSAEDLEAENVDKVEVFATFRPWWVAYNIQGIGTFFTALGLGWGAYWLFQMFGIDLGAAVDSLADRWGVSGAGSVVIAIVAAVIIGALGMATNFFAGFWNFELARTHTPNTTMLRTKRGLFSTREVNRDEARVRGLTISEPVLWRWIGMSDTNIITTGLGLWSAEQPTQILPRGPISVAREVAEKVFDESPSPMTYALRPHPARALRRRLVWALWISLGVAAFLAWPVISGATPTWLLWIPAGLLPVALLGGYAAYKALGHTIVGDYAVVRSGLFSRATSALRRDSVSTIAIRQSIFQRRLDLATVSMMTAAGWGIYQALDVAADDAIPLALDMAPGIMDSFVRTPPSV